MLKGEIKAVAPYGQDLTKLNVSIEPIQGGTPVLYPETESVYLRRATEGTGELMELVGGSVAWNQYANNANTPSNRSGITFGTGADYFSMSGTTTEALYAAGWFGLHSSTMAGCVNHKMLVDFKLISGTVSNTNELAFTVDGRSVNNVFLGTAKVVEYRSTVSNSTLNGTTAGTVFTDAHLRIQVTDLTLMLGPAIADYVYSLEQATAGSGIAWLKSYGFFEDYVAYSAPTLQSVEASAHVTVGFNQWDEEWRNGNYSTSTGAFTASGTYFANKNLIPVIPNTTYCFHVGDNSTFRIFSYSADGSYTGRYWERTANTTFTTDANTHFINFCGLTTNYGATYKNDICINISKTTGTPKNGDYVSYVKHTYPLDSDLVLRGIPKLNNGVLSYDGDTYEWDGTVTRYFGERAYQAGDESLTDAITDGTNTVYKLTTPTTESADPFTAVQTVEDGGTEEFVTTNGVPVGVVGRFANVAPISGHSLVNIYTGDTEGTAEATYTTDLQQLVYGGVFDAINGNVTETMDEIEEYNGETIGDPWLSSLDVYSQGATPTNGAQVVYTKTPTTFLIPPPTITTAKSYWWSDSGDVDWGYAMVGLGLMPVITLADPFE